MTLVQTLQVALTATHQAIYGYGLLGPRLPVHANGIGEPAANRAGGEQRLVMLQLLRDALAAEVRTAGATPVAAAPAYVPPTPVRNAADAMRLATALERTIAQAMYSVVAASPASSAARRLAVRQLAVAAAWEARWSDFWTILDAPPRPQFPGQPAASQPSTTPTSSPS